MAVSWTKEDFRKQWLKAGIDAGSVEKIADLLTERHFIHMLPTEESTSWSRWGGLPSLAPEEYKTDERFLCQIALSELPEGPARERLPQDGYLFFFIHRRGRDKGRVLHKNEVEDVDFSNEPSTHIAFEARMEYIAPEYETDEFDALDLAAEPGNIYMDWEEDYLENPKTRFKERCTLLSGWSENADDAARLLKRQTKVEWDVLLTLNPKENKAVSRSSIGDIPFLSQTLFYFIQSQALQEGNFDAIACRYGES